MGDKEWVALTEKSNALRAELKIWEKEFASANNGKKASRDDIKKNPEIGIFFLPTPRTRTQC
jgi:DNA replication regulator SLD2